MKILKENYKKTAFILSLLLIALTLFCLLWILFFTGDKPSAKRIAHIYQNGELIKSIPLNEVTESYTFTVIGDNDCRNEIEVRPGSIGILSADCPDKLCVHQGFIDSSLLPITCLPNHLVIQIQVEGSASSEDTFDGISY